MMNELFWVGVVVGILFAVLLVAAMYNESTADTPNQKPPGGNRTVYLKSDGWYWNDETYQEYGPLATREAAVEAQTKYVEHCL